MLIPLDEIKNKTPLFIVKIRKEGGFYLGYFEGVLVYKHRRYYKIMEHMEEYCRKKYLFFKKNKNVGGNDNK